MCAVAVITLRRFCIAELRHLAMVCVEVRFRDRLVASAALRHDFELESGSVNAPDRVCGMAVTTNRQRLVRLPNLLVVNACFKLLFDTMVATTARLRHVAGVHT